MIRKAQKKNAVITANDTVQAVRLRSQQNAAGVSARVLMRTLRPAEPPMVANLPSDSPPLLEKKSLAGCISATCISPLKLNRISKDFKALIEQVNQQTPFGFSFALLPGDIAEDGTEAQYELAALALKRLSLPIFASPEITTVRLARWATSGGRSRASHLRSR